MRTAGLVLAGGQAKRMGGGQKALLELDSIPLLVRVLTRLGGQVDEIAISANTELERYETFGHPLLPDTMDGFPGPLAGILAGMRWASGLGYSHIVSVAGDTPFFPEDLVARLEASGGPIGLAATNDRERGVLRQPTFGIWPVNLADDLEAALKDGTRKIVAWANRHGVTEVVYEPEPFDPFFNVNSPDDMVTATKYVAEFHL